MRMPLPARDPGAMETIVHARPAAGDRPTERSHQVPPAARVSMALTGALLAGVLTSFGQAVPALSVLSNSAGPWFVVAAALCLLAGVRAGRFALPLAMLLGVVLLELMHVGYWAATVLRGFADVLSVTNLWVLLGVPAGALAGAVAVAVRLPDPVGVPGGSVLRVVGWRGVALGATAAVLVGEGVRALLQVAASTGTVTWIVEIALGVVALALGVLSARTAVGRVVSLATGVLGTVAVLGAYLLLGA